jgi:6-pyruvoyltetrahydropterin/6-carboxytetrahydropterin synthase
MIDVGVEARFYATHALRGDFGPASALHGHHYRVRAIFCGENLRPEGILVDISLVESSLRSLSLRLAGQNLNELKPFTLQNPTAERLALYFWEELEKSLKGQLPQGVSLREVTLWESPGSFARVRAP